MEISHEQAQREAEIFFQGYWEGVRQMKEPNEVKRDRNARVKSCKTLGEFFGVNVDDYIWIDGVRYQVYDRKICGYGNSLIEDGQALVGCLTGQLEWSTTEIMTDEQIKLLKELAVWFPHWGTLRVDEDGDIVEGFRLRFNRFTVNSTPFELKNGGSKAYRVLVPILKKFGEIDLDNYRE